MTQTLLVSIIIALSVTYLSYRIWLAFKEINDPCHGCSGCALKEARKQAEKRRNKKPPCGNKKTIKKFVQSEDLQ